MTEELIKGMAQFGVPISLLVWFLSKAIATLWASYQSAIAWERDKMQVIGDSLDKNTEVLKAVFELVKENKNEKVN